MSEPIITTTDGGALRDDEDCAVLADLGFSHIMTLCSPNRQSDHAVRAAHNHDLRFVTRWPDYGGLGLCDDEHSFQVQNGTRNPNNNPRLAGPSHWNEDANTRSLEALPGLVELGVDGVVISAMISDRWFPTDWYPIGCTYIEHAWSWDPAARAHWAAHGNGMDMPERMMVGNGGPPPEPLLGFYRWYQAGWFDKLRRFTDAAIDAGLKEIWAYYIPLDFWDPENMADGTADSVPALTQWQTHIKERGAEPLVVTCGIRSLWPRWAVPGCETMRQVNQKLNWRSITTASTTSAPDRAAAIQHNGAWAAGEGFCGLQIGAIDTIVPQARGGQAERFKGIIAAVRAAIEKTGGETEE